MLNYSAFDKYNLDISELKVQQSKVWYEAKLKTMDPKLVTPAAILKTGGSKLTSRLVPGKLYAYFYMPQGKDELPFYDTFPLVFPFSKTAETFHGLNLHYLDYPMRFSLFKELMKVSNLTTLNENSKMKMNWSTIVGMTKLAPAQACVKQYRFDHIKSPFLEIEPKDWATALLLPMARFRGASQKAVWSESKKIGRSW